MPATKTDSPANVNRMIYDIAGNRDGTRDLLMTKGLPALFEKYKLNDAQRAALQNPGWQSFTDIGLLPMNQMTLLIMLDGSFREHLSIATHMDRYAAEIGGADQ